MRLVTSPTLHQQSTITASQVAGLPVVNHAMQKDTARFSGKKSDGGGSKIPWWVPLGTAGAVAGGLLWFNPTVDKAAPITIPSSPFTVDSTDIRLTQPKNEWIHYFADSLWIPGEGYGYNNKAGDHNTLGIGRKKIPGKKEGRLYSYHYSSEPRLEFHKRGTKLYPQYDDSPNGIRMAPDSVKRQFDWLVKRYMLKDADRYQRDTINDPAVQIIRQEIGNQEGPGVEAKILAYMKAQKIPQTANNWLTAAWDYRRGAIPAEYRHKTHQTDDDYLRLGPGRLRRSLLREKALLGTGEEITPLTNSARVLTASAKAVKRLDPKGKKRINPYAFSQHTGNDTTLIKLLNGWDNLSRMYRAKQVKWADVQHISRGGDNLEVIARRYGTTVDALRAYNSDGIFKGKLKKGSKRHNNDPLKGGQLITIPVTGVKIQPYKEKWYHGRVLGGPGTPSLKDIAKENGLSKEALKQYNPELFDGNKYKADLPVGTVVVLPKKESRISSKRPSSSKESKQK